MFRVTNQPIDLNELVAYVTDPEAGAIVPFIGTTRNNNEGRKVIALDYEAYPEMAEKELARIGDDYPLSREKLLPTNQPPVPSATRPAQPPRQPVGGCRVVEQHGHEVVAGGGPTRTVYISNVSIGRL